MKSIEQPTFWQFTMESAKEAVRLYFQPISNVAACLGTKLIRSEPATETTPQFDSLEDLQERLDLISRRVTTTEQQIRLQNLRAVLRYPTAQVSAKLQEEVRRLETDLGMETQVYPSPAKRTKGASGD